MTFASTVLDLFRHLFWELWLSFESSLGGVHTLFDILWVWFCIYFSFVLGLVVDHLGLVEHDWGYLLSLRWADLGMLWVVLHFSHHITKWY